MLPQETSLENILPLLPDFSPANILHSEITSLKHIVADILKEISQRKDLEGRLLSGLEKRAMHLRSELMNIQPSYTLNTLERIIALEHDVEWAQIEKIHTQERTAQDLLELKKLLWNHWLLLHKREAQQYFLK